ncbi:MAG: S8 family serine peptidase, partial [Gallionella sp.]
MKNASGRSGKVVAGALIFVSLTALTMSPADAAENAKQSSVVRNHLPQVSNRLIVKLRPNFVSRGLSKAQVAAELRRPFRQQEIDEIRGAAGLEMSEAHALSDGAHVLVIAGKRDRQMLDDAIARISSLANVEYVEEDKLFTPQLVAPNDTYFAAADPGLWGLYPVVVPVALPSHGGSGSYGADFETAWDTTVGTDVVVAVVDGGITPHVDIVGVNGTVSPATGNLISPGFDFISDCRIRGTCPATTAASVATTAPWSDPQPDATDRGDFISYVDSTTTGSLFYGEPVTNSTWHGTHIAGIIAAIGNNATGVIGGAYGVKILPVRALGKGAGNSSDVMEGVRWAAGLPVTGAPLNPFPAKVINLSLGGVGSCDRSEQDAIDAATAAGAVVVVAAGNDKMDIASFVPANCKNVISVAATARDGSRASYSNFSSPAGAPSPVFVTLAAPGGDIDSYDPGILSTVNASTTTPNISAGGSRYANYGGTSMASAHVAAAVALIFS